MVPYLYSTSTGTVATGTHSYTVVPRSARLVHTLIDCVNDHGVGVAINTPVK